MSGNEAEIAANMERAEESLRAARDLTDGRYHDIAASRAYYAAFYAAKAILLSEGLDSRKHAGVIASVHQHLVKTGRLDREYGQQLNWLFGLRNVGDYGVTFHVSPEEAQRAIEAAEKFVAAIRAALPD